MSWQFHQAANRRIENAIEEQKIDIDTLLDDPDLLSSVNQKLPKLTSFLLQHAQDLIEFAFEDEIDEQKRSNAFDILLNYNPIINLISKDSDLASLIVTYFLDDRKSSVSVLCLMNHLIESTNASFLQQIDKPSDFLRHLIDRIEILNVEDFLLFLFSNTTVLLLRKWLFSDVQADKILYSYLNPNVDLKIQQKILKLLLKFVQTTEKLSPSVQNSEKMAPTLVNLCDPVAISYILDLGIKNSTNSLSNYSFQYIYELSSTIYDSERMKNQMSSIRSIISDNLEALCNYVQSNHNFTCDKRYAIELIILVIQVKKEVEKYIFTFSKFLFNLFLELQSNSFLHNVFLKLFKILAAFHGDFVIFLKSTKILTLFPSLAANRATMMHASYWGHIYKMTAILKKMIEDGLPEISIPNAWDSYIESTFDIQHRIKNNPYGGPLPTYSSIFDSDDILNDSGSFYHCHFVDSCDLMSRKNHHDSDSDAYEEESENSPILSDDDLQSPPSSPIQYNEENDKKSTEDSLSIFAFSSSSSSSSSNSSSDDS